MVLVKCEQCLESEQELSCIFSSGFCNSANSQPQQPQLGSVCVLVFTSHITFAVTFFKCCNDRGKKNTETGGLRTSHCQEIERQGK